MMSLWRFVVTTLVVSSTLLTTINAEEESQLKVNVYKGPSSSEEKCNALDAIQKGSYATIHFTVSIDESSAVGEKGKQYESTRDAEGEGDPIGVILGMGDVIPGWDQGLMGLCQGDQVILVVPPQMAYGEEGTDDIPGGSTIKFDIEIVSVLEGPPEEEDDEEAIAMFHNADGDKDGKLSRVEFDAMFAEQIGDVSDADEMSAIQSQLQIFWDSQDEDKDGFLSLEEFLAPSHFDDVGDEDSHHDPEEEFNDLDTDNDGKLSKEEIQSFFTSVGQEVPDDFWEHLDENKDGFITYEEFFVADEVYEDDEFGGDEEADEL